MDGDLTKKVLDALIAALVAADEGAWVELVAGDSLTIDGHFDTKILLPAITKAVNQALNEAADRAAP